MLAPAERVALYANKPEQRRDKALDLIDEIITTIRASADKDAARTALQAAPFEFSEVQAEYILDMQLHRLTRLGRSQLEEEMAKLLATIAELEAILGDRDRGAGIFLLAHSNGSELVLRMATAPAGADLLGIEISGTGIEQQPEARRILAGASAELDLTEFASSIGELFGFLKGSATSNVLLQKPYKSITCILHPP